MEVANQILQEVLRKINAEQGFSWVEALPAALNHIHNTPGPSGLSPYQILFGREKLMGNIPYSPPMENEDAQAYFQKMRGQDKKVAELLNRLHERRAAKENESRKEPPEYVEGQRLWYLRPEGSADKLGTRWIGPAIVVKPIGLHSYEIQVGERNVLSAHSSRLKPYVEDEWGSEEVPLFLHKRTVPDPHALPDEWVVDKVVDVKFVNGIPHFKVHWEGFEEGDAQWEPPENFFHRYGAPVIQFCQEGNIPLDVTKFLSPEPN